MVYEWGRGPVGGVLVLWMGCDPADGGVVVRAWPVDGGVVCGAWSKWGVIL